MRLNVHEWGERTAPPLICLHGIAAHGLRFRKLAEERLKKSFRVLAVDLRGHGRSGHDPPWDVATHVDDVLETADELGVERACWMGHSFGGRLVAELAARAPGRVERAVLLDPALHVAAETARESAEGARADVSFASVDEAVAARLSAGGLFHTPRGLVEEDMREHLVRGEDGRLRARVSQPAVITGWSEMTRRPPPPPEAPTLVVLGDQSWLPVDVTPSGQLRAVTVPGGHVVLWDAFAETADAIEAFLEAR